MTPVHYPPTPIMVYQAPAPARHIERSIEIHHTPCNMEDATHECIARVVDGKWVVTVRPKRSCTSYITDGATVWMLCDDGSLKPKK